MMKKVYVYLSLLLVFFICETTSTSAIGLSNYQVFRIFDLPINNSNEELNVSVELTPINDTKRIAYTVKANSVKEGGRYSFMYFLKVDKDFGNNFAKDIKVEYGGISGIGKNIGPVNIQLYKTNKEEDKKIYKGQISYAYLDNGINYITFCATDARAGGGVYTNLKCERPPREIFYIKEFNKIVNKEEFQEYDLKEQEKIKKKRKKELLFLEKKNKYFDENKVLKSRFGKNTKIKTSEELYNLIINSIIKNKTLLTKKNYIDIYHNIADKYFKFDDNDKVFMVYSDFERYVLYTIKEYIYQKEHSEEKKQNNINNQNLNDKQNVKTNKNNSNNEKEYTNSSEAFEDFKKKNSEDRNKAISFSKKMLEALEKYSDKSLKLKKIQEIKNILDTKFSSDKYENQNLIGYVKDYLDIVEYAIQIQ